LFRIQVAIPTAIPTLPTAEHTVPILTATTLSNVTLQHACSCRNNATVWVHHSQRCNLLLLLTLSLTSDLQRVAKSVS